MEAAGGTQADRPRSGRTTERPGASSGEGAPRTDTGIESGELRIGTSGFDYLDWQGPFYPEGLGRADFLGFYAQRFRTLELNFSYYRMPSAPQLAGLLARAGGELDFSIKAHQSLTHKVDPLDWRGAAAEFRAALAPLWEAGRLAAVLVQFPFSFHYEPDNRRYLDALLRELAGLPLVVELRNARWLNDRVLDGLRRRRVAFCCVDAPALRGMLPAVDVVTADLAYVRFHGRNGRDWWGGDAAARFDYLYSAAELDGWLGRLQAMAASARRVRVYFNNHRRGQAVANALDLGARIQAASLQAGRAQ